MTRSYYAIIPRPGLSRVICYRWPDAVSEWAAMIGQGLDAVVIQTHSNLVSCDVTDEARADWLGEDEPGESAYTWESVNVYGRDEWVTA